MTEFTKEKLAELREHFEMRAGLRSDGHAADVLALIAALEAKTAEAQRIPLYAMLDVFQVVTGTSHPEWDRLYEKHGYAESWARVIAMVRDAVRERDEARAEVDMWTKPQECVIEHEQPYDFKQCSTHDRTFPLDGDCDYRGLSIIDWQDDQVMKQRGRAVKAEMRADRAEDAIERVREAATEVTNQGDNNGRTHYEGCWKQHLHCLAAKIIYETEADDE